MCVYRRIEYERIKIEKEGFKFKTKLENFQSKLWHMQALLLAVQMVGLRPCSTAKSIAGKDREMSGIAFRKVRVQVVVLSKINRD